MRAGKVEDPSREGLMQWRLAAAVVLSIAMTGCPSEFVKDGRVNKAAHKDTLEMVIRRCSNERIEEVCGRGKEDSDDCRKCRQ
jgi:hypothetical protein